MFSNSRSFYVKYKNITIYNSPSGTQYYLLKKTPSILCLVCKDQLCRLHQTRS